METPQCVSAFFKARFAPHTIWRAVTLHRTYGSLPKKNAVKAALMLHRYYQKTQSSSGAKLVLETLKWPACNVNVFVLTDLHVFENLTVSATDQSSWPAKPISWRKIPVLDGPIALSEVYRALKKLSSQTLPGSFPMQPYVPNSCVTPQSFECRLRLLNS